MNKHPIHIQGIICWLPPSKPGRSHFPPEYPFLAQAIFTSDLHAPTMRDAFINYSPDRCCEPGECFKVRICFMSLIGQDEELNRLVKNSELIIMDSYKVIAVCRKLSLAISSGYIEDEGWRLNTTISRAHWNNAPKKLGEKDK